MDHCVSLRNEEAMANTYYRGGLFSANNSEREQIRPGDQCSKLTLETKTLKACGLSKTFWCPFFLVSQFTGMEIMHYLWWDQAFSLWCALQDKIYIMGCAAAGGLWRHPRWRYLDSHFGFYPKLKLIDKTADIEIVDYEIIKHYSASCQRFVLLIT